MRYRARMADDISTLRRILKSCRTIAVVGLSAEWHRPSFFAAKYMQQHGYRIVPVNPREKKILGETTYASLKDIPFAVDVVDVFRQPDVVPAIAEEAAAIALAAWRSASRPSTTVRAVTAESPEYRGALPAWRVAFADPDNTAVYVVAGDGRISAVRTGTWRLYDFFWGLHIMDWKNHENFNTPWLLGFAIGGLVLGIFGTILLFLRWPGRRRPLQS